MKKKKKIILIILLSILCMLLSFISYVVFTISQVHLDTDLLDAISTPIQIYDTENSKLNEDISGSAKVSIEDLNQYTLDAFIDIEDKNFYSHNGISIGRICKAFFNNLLSGKIEQGASTISQQLIKNTHLSNEKTISRKIKEIALAMQLEKKYTKNQILEMYLNAIYFGNGCYGIESASNFYFNKKASDLTISESAILAGIIKSPYHYNPINFPKNITDRKNLILKKMYEQKSINQNQFDVSKSQPISLDINQNQQSNNSSYYFAVIDEASTILDCTPSQLASKKYKIYTYFDKEIDQMLKDSCINDTNALHNGIVVQNQTFGIVAYNSNIKYGAIGLKRTPASTIKPLIVYAPAIEKGILQPASIILDEPTIFLNNYSPKNINNKYYGQISASKALANSLNVPAVKILQDTSINYAKDFARNLGIKFDANDNGLSLALGSMRYGITIQELINAYSPFCLNGEMKKCTFIKKITTSNNEVIYENKNEKIRKMKQETASLVGKMLEDVVQSGTCTALKNLGYEIRAKSGTNGTSDPNKNTDALCLAQTSEHTACIWYFSKDYTNENLIESSTISGLSPTLRIKYLFEQLYRNHKPENFTNSSKISEVKLDLLDYQKGQWCIANQSTPSQYTINYFFDDQHTPKNYSQNFQNLYKPILNYDMQSNIGNIKFKFIASLSQVYELIQEEYQNNECIKTKVLKTFEKCENLQTYQTQIDQSKQYKFFIRTRFLADEEYYILSNIIDLSPYKIINTDINRFNRFR